MESRYEKYAITYKDKETIYLWAYSIEQAKLLALRRKKGNITEIKLV